MIPSSLTTRYRHVGCCTEFAGVVVELHAIVHVETGSYVPPPPPRCVLSHAELVREELPAPTYPRS